MHGNMTAKRINVLFSYALKDIYDNYFYTLRLQLDGNVAENMSVVYIKKNN